MEDKITLDQVEASMDGIVEKYATEFYPFEVVQSGGGWQFLTKKEYHKTVAQINGDKFMKRLSAAAIETLAIVAYKQPVTKGEIEAIRGVSADYAVQKLLEKDLIVISGRNEKLPGHPLVYSTSRSFMDYFGINSSDDLPKIKEVLAEHLVEPTVVSNSDEEVNEEIIEADDEKYLSVTENGELIATDDLLVEGQSPEVGAEGEMIDNDEEIPATENSNDEFIEEDFSGDEKKQAHEEDKGDDIANTGNDETDSQKDESETNN